MYRRLFFICPTDNLETLINKNFRQENYFLTSLGNSVTFDIVLVGHIKDLILKKNIQQITFVLSDDNLILSNDKRSQELLQIDRIANLNNQIVIQQRYSEPLWLTRNDKLLIFSYHLRNKIRELYQGLSSLNLIQLNIGAKVYHRKKNVFRDIPYDLICLDRFNLN